MSHVYLSFAVRDSEVFRCVRLGDVPFTASFVVGSVNAPAVNQAEKYFISLCVCDLLLLSSHFLPYFPLITHNKITDILQGPNSDMSDAEQPAGEAGGVRFTEREERVLKAVWGCMKTPPEV